MIARLTYSLTCHCGPTCSGDRPESESTFLYDALHDGVPRPWMQKAHTVWLSRMGVNWEGGLDRFDSIEQVLRVELTLPGNSTVSGLIRANALSTGRWS